MVYPAITDATARTWLSDVIDSLPAAVFRYDAQARLVLWNSRVQEFFPALHPRLSVGMPYADILVLSKDIVAPGPTGSEDLGILGFRTDQGTFEQRLVDGRWLQGLDRSTSDGGTVCFRFDITESKLRELDLRQAQKMEALGVLTGGVAHDFNNVLQVISGAVELAKLETAPAEPVREHLAIVADACKRAADVTRQLLTFSRKQPLHVRPLDLNEVLRSFEKMLKWVLTSRIALDIRAGAGLDAIVADAGMVEQVLMNLAVNARDAIREGGRVMVESHLAEFDDAFCQGNAWAQPGRYVALRFSDTGIGMTRDVLERAFEPFFTTKAMGTGLGLSTVYGIVRQHKGLIRVESHPGSGTAFSIYWPAQTSSAPAGAAPPGTQYRGGSETILVAEDEDAIRQVAVLLLERAGYRVLSAADGEEVLSAYAEHAGAIRAIVLDLNMPRMGGRECYRKLRRIGAGIPVIFSSGWFGENDEALRQEKRVTLIHKPYTPEVLLQAVRSALDGRAPASEDRDGRPAPRQAGAAERE